MLDPYQPLDDCKGILDLCAVNVGTYKKTTQQKPRKSSILSSTKEEKNMIEL